VKEFSDTGRWAATRPKRARLFGLLPGMPEWMIKRNATRRETQDPASNPETGAPVHRRYIQYNPVEQRLSEPFWYSSARAGRELDPRPPWLKPGSQASALVRSAW